MALPPWLEQATDHLRASSPTGVHGIIGLSPPPPEVLTPSPAGRRPFRYDEYSHPPVLRLAEEMPWQRQEASKRRKLQSRASNLPPQHADVATSYRWELYGEKAMQPDGSIFRYYLRCTHPHDSSCPARLVVDRHLTNSSTPPCMYRDSEHAHNTLAHGPHSDRTAGASPPPPPGAPPSSLILFGIRLQPGTPVVPPGRSSSAPGGREDLAAGMTGGAMSSPPRERCGGMTMAKASPGGGVSEAGGGPWLKYGEKALGSEGQRTRCYYRCTHPVVPACPARKVVDCDTSSGAAVTRVFDDNTHSHPSPSSPAPQLALPPLIQKHMSQSPDSSAPGVTSAAAPASILGSDLKHLLGGGTSLHRPPYAWPPLSPFLLPAVASQGDVRLPRQTVPEEALPKCQVVLAQANHKAAFLSMQMTGGTRRDYVCLPPGMPGVRFQPAQSSSHRSSLSQGEMSDDSCKSHQILPAGILGGIPGGRPTEESSPKHQVGESIEPETPGQQTGFRLWKALEGTAGTAGQLSLSLNL